MFACGAAAVNSDEGVGCSISEPAAALRRYQAGVFELRLRHEVERSVRRQNHVESKYAYPPTVRCREKFDHAGRVDGCIATHAGGRVGRYFTLFAKCAVIAPAVRV